jgi:hypothetical protein
MKINPELSNIRENKVKTLKTIAVECYPSVGAIEMGEKDLAVKDPENASEIIRICGENFKHHGADICIRDI